MFEIVLKFYNNPHARSKEKITDTDDNHKSFENRVRKTEMAELRALVQLFSSKISGRNRGKKFTNHETRNKIGTDKV